MVIDCLELNQNSIREFNPSGRCMVRLLFMWGANANTHEQIPIYEDGIANKN